MCWQSSPFSSVWVPTNSSSVLLTVPLCSPATLCVQVTYIMFIRSFLLSKAQFCCWKW